MNPVEAMFGLAKWMLCDRTPADEAARRASICRQCPSLVHMRVKGTAMTAGFCGKPVAPTERTCGCLVLWGQGTNPTQPSGKCGCVAESCPQGRWQQDSTTSPAA